MVHDECFILPMPVSVANLHHALILFAEQYDSIALMEVCGHFVGSQREAYHFATWQLVARIDGELDLLGLGVLGADDESVLWLVPVRDVQVRFSLMEEEN